MGRNKSHHPQEQKTGTGTMPGSVSNTTIITKISSPKLMTSSLLFELLFNTIYFLRDDTTTAHKLNTFCARNTISVARARRSTMRLSPYAGVTPLHIVCLLWLSWAAQHVRSWAWGPYNDDWKKHILPKDAVAANMYRVVLPRANGTAPTFFSTGNSSANGTGTSTGTVPLSTWTPPTYTNSTTNSSTTTKIDTDCGVSSPLYNLQISGADGFTFNEWWLKLSGNMVLFTSQKAKATPFGVNSDTKHLCIPRNSSTSAQSRPGKLPLIAIVETRLDQGPLYFLDANRTEGFEPEYEPIVCDSLSEGLMCSWPGDNGGAGVWAGCGLQLELGTSLEATDSNLNCSSISLSAFEA